MDLLAEARRRLDAGDPKSAHLLAQRALDAGRSQGSRETTASAAHLVGEALYVLGDLEAARPLAEEALRAHEELGRGAAIAADLNLVGVLDLTEGRTDEAVVALRRSLDLRTEELGLDDAETIESLNNLAVALWRGGDEVEALRLHEEALERCERSLGEDHRRTAETLNALAVKLPARPGQERRARQLSERALASAEAALGPDSELVARMLANVATTRMNDGELEAAGPLLERSLELHERHFGPMSRWTAYVLSFAAEHAWAEGRFEDSRGFFERVFVIRMAESGPTDPETLDAALGLMNVLGELGGAAHLVRESPEASPGADALELMTAFYLPLIALHPDLQGAFPQAAPIR
jgi:tetratricopeptide (TPR) repeat protein